MYIRVYKYLHIVLLLLLYPCWAAALRSFDHFMWHIMCWSTETQQKRRYKKCILLWCNKFKIIERFYVCIMYPCVGNDNIMFTIKAVYHLRIYICTYMCVCVHDGNGNKRSPLVGLQNRYQLRALWFRTAHIFIYDIYIHTYLCIYIYIYTTILQNECTECMT